MSIALASGKKTGHARAVFRYQTNKQNISYQTHTHTSVFILLSHFACSILFLTPSRRFLILLLTGFIDLSFLCLFHVFFFSSFFTSLPHKNASHISSIHPPTYTHTPHTHHTFSNKTIPVIIPIVLQFFSKNSQKDDWKFRNAGLMALSIVCCSLRFFFPPICYLCSSCVYTLLHSIFAHFFFSTYHLLLLILRSLSLLFSHSHTHILSF